MKYLKLFEQFEIEKGDILNHPYRTLNDVTEDIMTLSLYTPPILSIRPNLVIELAGVPLMSKYVH